MCAVSMFAEFHKKHKNEIITEIIRLIYLVVLTHDSFKKILGDHTNVI